MSYKITGPFEVAGKSPGEILDVEDLAGCNISALIEAGHIVIVKPEKEQK